MPEGAFFEQKRLSPTSLTIVIALHGAALTALMMSKTEFVTELVKPTKVTLIKAQQDPPPEPEILPQTPPPAETVTWVPPVVQRPVEKPIEVTLRDLPEVPTVTLVAPPPFRPADPPALPKVEPRAPIRTAAVMRSDAELQPAYPASEQRAGAEGMVTVRVLIGTDGRVKAVERVRAASEDFYRATERQALRHWRFKPATVDGKPVETRQTVTVHFELMG